jgi:ribose transport system substrate-binding protein
MFVVALVAVVSACGTAQAPESAIPDPSPETVAAGRAVDCTIAEPVMDKLLKIAVVPKGSTGEFWKSVEAGSIKAELELDGVQTIWKGPTKEDDREQQINVIESFISSGVHGIALAPLDDVAIVGPVRDAIGAGVSVAIMDSGLQADPCRDFASFVATDNDVGGRKAARRLGDLLDGKGRVLLLRYMVGHASTTKREEGFLDVLREEYPEIEIVSSDQYAGTTTESTYAKAESLLVRFPELDGIFCPNESSTFGMLLALRDAGRAGKVSFVGFDSSEKLVEALKLQHIHGLVIQDPLNMGYTAVKTLVAYLRGATVPVRIDTGSVVATPENMNEPRMQELLAPPVEKYLD